MARRCTRSSLPNDFVMTSFGKQNTKCSAGENTSMTLSWRHVNWKQNTECSAGARGKRIDDFVMTSCDWKAKYRMQGKTHRCKQRKQSDRLNVHSFVLYTYHSCMYREFTVIVSIFPTTVFSTFPQKSVVGRHCTNLLILIRLLLFV